MRKARRESVPLDLVGPEEVYLEMSWTAASVSA